MRCEACTSISIADASQRSHYFSNQFCSCLEIVQQIDVAIFICAVNVWEFDRRTTGKISLIPPVATGRGLPMAAVEQDKQSAVGRQGAD